MEMASHYKTGCRLMSLISLFMCIEAIRKPSNSGPQNTVIREGETAILECTVERRGAETVRWYRVVNDVVTPLSRDEQVEGGASPAAGQYQIVGNHANGEYNLQITDVNRLDSGEYRCGYGMGPRDDITSVELQVVVPPDVTSPFCMILQDPTSTTFSYLVGDTVRLMCMSSGGAPPASLQWKRGDTVLTSKTSHMAILEKVIAESDLGEQFTCYAESLALDAARSCSLVPAPLGPLEVRIMPEVASLPLQGGTTFACEAEGAVSTDSSFKWFVDGTKVSTNGGRTRRLQVSPDGKSLTIGMIRASDDGAVVKCQLHSSTGLLGEAEARLRVVDAPETTTSIRPTTSSAPPPVSTSWTTEMVDPSGRDNMTSEMPASLIVVSALAGLAIGALAIIALACIFKKHRNRQTRGADRRNPNPSSTPKSRPAMAVQPMRQTPRSKVPADVLVSEDGYTALKKQGTQPSGERYTILEKPMNSDDYEAVGMTAPPTSPRLDQAGTDDMYWDYEIPYTGNHSQRQAKATSNPIYLEILE